jgi:hypothetical protein
MIARDSFYSLFILSEPKKQKELSGGNGYNENRKRATGESEEGKSS